MKRVLSLALSTVMLMGMMVVGTGAANYSDVAVTDNVEAIEVLNAVGVMVGDGEGFNPDQKVTRNEMAVVMANLLGLNTLKADVVDFTGTIGSDINTSDGTSVSIGYRSEYTALGADSKNYNYAAVGTDARARLQLAEKLFGNDLRLTGSAEDSFGRPSNRWTYKAKEFGVYAKEATLTYTDVVKSSKIYSDLGLSANEEAAVQYGVGNVAKFVYIDAPAGSLVNDISGVIYVAKASRSQQTTDKNGTIGLGASRYTAAEDVVVYVVDSGKITESTFAAVGTDSNDGYYAVTKNGQTKTLFISKNSVTTPVVTAPATATVGTPFNVTLGNLEGTTTVTYSITGSANIGGNKTGTLAMSAGDNTVTLAGGTAGDTGFITFRVTNTVTNVGSAYSEYVVAYTVPTPPAA